MGKNKPAIKSTVQCTHFLTRTTLPTILILPNYIIVVSCGARELQVYILGTVYIILIYTQYRNYHFVVAGSD